MGRPSPRASSAYPEGFDETLRARLQSVDIDAKRRPGAEAGMEAWYPYYAGYTEEFAAEVIEAAETFEVKRIKNDALKAIEELKLKGPEWRRDTVWWGQAGQTLFALGCVAAAAAGQVEFGVPCVIGGALSSAALKYLVPQQ